LATFKDVRVQLEGVVREILSKTYLRSVGDFAADMIRLRTRLGYGVARDGASRERLKPLSPGYKKQRKKMKLNENTSATKSNLTKTGQLLSSVKTKAVTNKGVLIGPEGSRRDGLTNEELGQYVTEQGRPFNHLSNVEIKRITDKIRQDVQTMILKALVKLR
jgi:hypothetical protein